MLGLPSTTEVGRRIPKEAFYGRLKVSAALRQSFIDDVERFVAQTGVDYISTSKITQSAPAVDIGLDEA